jgi:hypothetical protein
MKIEIGAYEFPRQVGYSGWCAFEKCIAFEALDGKVIIVEKP